MMSLLLQEFINQEATPSVCKLILDRVGQLNEQPKESIHKFEFNRFEITLDFSNKVVFIEDVLEPGPDGELSVGLDEFMDALQNA